MPHGKRVGFVQAAAMGGGHDTLEWRERERGLSITINAALDKKKINKKLQMEEKSE